MSRDPHGRQMRDLAFHHTGLRERGTPEPVSRPLALEDKQD